MIDFVAIDEHVQVCQKLNRVIRVRNKRLRTQLLEAQRQMDDVFLALDSTPTLAEEALEKIRTLGELQCDAGDYDSVVKLVLDKLGKQQTNTPENSDNYSWDDLWGEA